MPSFKYNGKIYSPKNVEKKLKQLGISEQDIEYCEDPYKQKKTIETEIDSNNPKLYKFINSKNGYTLLSIHSSLEDIKANDCRKDIEWYDDFKLIEE